MNLYIKLWELKDQMLKDNEYMIDFTDCNFKVNFLDPYLSIMKVIIIEERHLARPDLLCYEAYGDTNSIDALLKFNQICNPFSMQEFDMIIVPNLQALERFYQKTNKITSTINNTKALFLDPKRASQKDVNRLKQLAKIASKRKNGSKSPKPTNLLRDGEVPFLADGTALRLAPSISSPRLSNLISNVNQSQ